MKGFKENLLKIEFVVDVFCCSCCLLSCLLSFLLCKLGGLTVGIFDFEADFLGEVLLRLVCAMVSLLFRCFDGVEFVDDGRLDSFLQMSYLIN